MAYSTINKSTEHFTTKLVTGNSSSNDDNPSNQQTITGLSFQPDWLWGKNRVQGNPYYHVLVDAVRGSPQRMYSNSSLSESTDDGDVENFTSDGFKLGSGLNLNKNGESNVFWLWRAGGASPSQTYVVKVVSDSGNKYRFDDFGTSAVTLDLQEGGTYTFDQSDSSNATHPLRFYTAADKSGGEYTTGVTTNGTPGSSGAYTRITVAASAPTLYYQCSSHAGIGGQVNTNSTFGSSNFSGSIQSTVSANTTAGFSMVSYTGTGSNPSTVGHGLGVTPKMIVVKPRSVSYSWCVYHEQAGNNNLLYFDTNGAAGGSSVWNSTSPTSSVFTVNDNQVNKSSETHIAYCFAEINGYSKFGSYKGNGSSNGTFVYCGFRPEFIMVKRSDGGSENWFMLDNKRDDGMNPRNSYIMTNSTNAEDSNNSTVDTDFLSNGFKLRATTGALNGNGNTYIFMAFGQTMVGSNDIPTTAR